VNAESDLSINNLYEKARTGDKSAENELFRTLSVRFRAFTGQRIGDYDDCNDIVQNAILTISKEYKEMDFTVSFSAWAYKVLKNRMLKYFDSRKRSANIDSLSNDMQSPSNFRPDPDLEVILIRCLKKISQTNLKYARIVNLYYQGYSILCPAFESSIDAQAMS
jgi:RNA polymerase sigma-70 factor (ECF subfamily)